MYLFLGLTCEPKQYSFCSVDYLPSVTTGSNVNPNKTCKSFFKISPSFLRQNLVLQVSANSM